MLQFNGALNKWHEYQSQSVVAFKLSYSSHLHFMSPISGLVIICARMLSTVSRHKVSSAAKRRHLFKTRDIPLSLLRAIIGKVSRWVRRNRAINQPWISLIILACVQDIPAAHVSHRSPPRLHVAIPALITLRFRDVATNAINVSFFPHAPKSRKSIRSNPR